MKKYGKKLPSFPLAEKACKAGHGAYPTMGSFTKVKRRK